MNILAEHRTNAFHVLAFVVGLGITSAGCGETPEGVQDDGIRYFDEDGVATVEVSGLWSRDWPELPGVLIDTLVSPEEGDGIGLFAPLHAAMLPDGRLIFADAGTVRVWLQGESGDWEEAVGPGQGPGELRSIGGVWAAEEGFWAYDSQTAQLLLFNDRGILLQQQPVVMGEARQSAMHARGPWPSSVQHLGDDAWLLTIPGQPEPDPATVVMRSEILFLSVFGEPVAEEIELGHGWARPVVVEGGGGAPVPFAPTALASGARGRIALFQGDTSRVDVLDHRGNGLFRIRWTDRPRALDGAHRAALGDFMRELTAGDGPSPGLDQMIEALNERIPYPETLPHLGDLRIGWDGAVWLGWPERSGLEMPTEPELTSEWRVVVEGSDRASAEVYRISLPPGTTLLGSVALPGGNPGHTQSHKPGVFLLLRDDLGQQGLGVLRYTLGEG